ncbi:uncharacterized protein LOC108237734 isoform X2 [Kryptolebias marmoratus]|nr:uncharacterized protein LOC108237734 isoform X2 [Kryptolebias marmoratus]
MKDIRERDDKIDLTFSHVAKSEKKGKAFGEFLKSKFQLNADSRHAELENELTDVLKDTAEGLEELHVFLDAVEKLAVTSLHVFIKNQMLHLPETISFKDIQAVITAAQQICPLLLVFKRDTNTFFLPTLQNVEVLEYMLEKYTETTKDICEKLGKRDMDLETAAETAAEFDVALCENDKQKMADHIKQLDKIRMDEDFQLVFLFQNVSCSRFINEFNERQPRMLEFLNELEQRAVQLDRMCKGAKISSVAGSSVGAVGGVLSIVGLALIPVTAGVSLTLTMAGVGLGITSGVNSMVTTATNIGVNHTHQKKANEVFKTFMKDVQSIQDCLEEVTSQPAANVEPSEIDVAVGVGMIASNIGTIGRGIDSMADAASALKVLQTEGVVTSAGKVVAQEGEALRNAPKVASDIPDISQAAVKGSLTASQGARSLFIAANALFLGMDVFFITMDSMTLAKGCETKVSKFIRARSALWLSEIESWEKICNSLCESKLTKDENRAILEKPFYPWKKI